MSNYKGCRGRRVKVSDVSDPVFVVSQENVASEEARSSFNDYWIITELISFGRKRKSLNKYQKEENIFLTMDLSSLYFTTRRSL